MKEWEVVEGIVATRAVRARRRDVRYILRWVRSGGLWMELMLVGCGRWVRLYRGADGAVGDWGSMQAINCRRGRMAAGTV